MRPTTFDPKLLRQYLLRHKIATLPELKGALGTDVGLTVFRKLKSLAYLSSYSHRGSYYTLAEIARFDDKGLWSHKTIWFSRYGTLLATVESFLFQLAEPGNEQILSIGCEPKIQGNVRIKTSGSI